MDIRFHSTVLMTDNFEGMTAFYREVLLQEPDVDFGNCLGFKCGISIWKMSPELPLAKKLGRTFDSAGNRNLEICLESDDFDEALSHVEKHLSEYLHGLIEEPWGQRTVRFYDPDGNLVELGESVPSFVKRFHKQGLSEEEVSQRCHVPLDLVRQIINK